MKFNFLKIESYKKGIILSTSFNFISRLLLFLQSIAIAYYFGTQDKTDVFFYCFTTITLVAYFVNSLDSSVLIPEAMRLREQQNERESVKFLNFFIYSYSFVGLTSTVVLLFFPIEALHVFSKFGIPVLKNNLEIIFLSIPLFGFMIITNLLVNILASYKFFTMPMIIGAINNIVSLLSLILFHDSLNIMSILIGQICAYVFNIIFLVYLMKKRIRWDFSFQKIKIERRIVYNIFLAQLGNVTSTLSSYAPMYMLSGLGTGIISALTYGQKTAEVPNQLISVQASAVVGIKMNESHAKGDMGIFNNVFISVTNLLVFVLVPISFILFMFSEDIIILLYKRGAFNLASVETSTLFFKFFVLTLPLLAINATGARMLMAGHKIAQQVIYQILANCALILMIYMGLHHLGIGGYLIALICYHISNVVMIYFVFKIIFPQVQYTKVLSSLVKAFVLNTIIFFAISYLVNPLLNNISHVAILNMGIASLMYLFSLISLNSLLGLNHEVILVTNQSMHFIKNVLKLKKHS